MKLAKDLFQKLPVPGRDIPNYTTLQIKAFVTVQGTPIDVEWIPQHYASAKTVLLRIPAGWAEAWGEDITLPVPFAEITEEQLREAVLGYFKHEDALVPCSDGCGAMTWNRKHYPSQYRDTRCAVCWFKGFNAEAKKLQAKEDAKVAKRDAKRKAEGYTHKLVAWVHPSAGGDDYMLEGYSRGALPDAEIQTMLKRRRSSVLTDYKQTAL